MNSTSLTGQEVTIIEQLMLLHGSVVTMEQIQALLGNLSSAQIRKRVSQLVRKGWLYRVKRGVYAICDISQRGSLPLSVYTIAHLLVADSYVSFEAALQHHGMYDQFLATIRSVSLTRYKASEVAGIEYRFIAAGEQHFFGWDAYRMDGKAVKIASAEKALIDLIQYHRSTYSVDLVLEVLRDHRENLDFDLLHDFLLLTNVAVQRIFGFLLEIVKVEDVTNRLHDLVRKHRNSSRVTADSDIFIGRWRLYINEHLHGYRSSTSGSAAQAATWTYSY